MPYPAAPWNLHGYAVQTLHLIECDRVRSIIPPELEIMSILPGRTLGGVYLSHYGAGSVLQYSELIVVAALVRYGNKIGLWISHVYVDNPDSVAGGREIWGLPKQLAEFSWQFTDRQAYVIVHQQQQTLCALDYGNPFSFWHQSFSGNSFGMKNADLLLFDAKANLRPGLVSAALRIPVGSPFAKINLDRPWLAVVAQDLQLVVTAPQILEPLKRQH
jgi:hypothetical protein